MSVTSLTKLYDHHYIVHETVATCTGKQKLVFDSVLIATCALISAHSKLTWAQISLLFDPPQADRMETN